jgi:hypothetical protein
MIPAFALYATICLWSHADKVACREVPLTPGVAGPGFESVDQCTQETPDTISRWLDAAGDVFGFKSMQGDGYQITALRCGPYVKPDDLDD